VRADLGLTNAKVRPDCAGRALQAHLPAGFNRAWRLHHTLLVSINGPDFMKLPS